MGKDKYFILILRFTPSLVLGCAKDMIKKSYRKEIEIETIKYNSNNWELRREAISKVSSYNTQEAVDLLIKALEDTHSSIRIEAIKGIGRVTPIKAKKKIKEIAEFESINNIRYYAITSLAQYDDVNTAPIFVKGLESKDWFIREGSIKGLLKINDAIIKYFSIPYIIKSLNDTNENVRITTLNHLNIKDSKIYIILKKILYKDIYSKISLLKGTLRALKGYKLDGKIQERIIEFLTHSNKEIRLLSLAVLKENHELNKMKIN